MSADNLLDRRSRPSDLMDLAVKLTLIETSGLSRVLCLTCKTSAISHQVAWRKCKYFEALLIPMMLQFISRFVESKMTTAFPLLLDDWLVSFDEELSIAFKKMVIGNI